MPRFNPPADRPLTMVEVQNVMVQLAVPKDLRARFLEGLDVEWSEHGGGVEPLGVGALVLDHLQEDRNYYRKMRSGPVANPAVRIPRNMRPLIEKYASAISKLASRTIHAVTGEPLIEQWTPATKPLGAGSWGVVYPTVDPRFIVKVTADPTEGPIVSAILAEPVLHNHMGIIHYFALRQLPEMTEGAMAWGRKGRSYPVYVIIAERLKDVGALARSSYISAYATGTRTADQILGNQLFRVKEAATPLVKEKRRKRPRAWMLEKLDDAYMTAVGDIRDGPLQDFFFQFRDVTGDGVLADVHLNNVGKRAVDWETVTNGAVPLSGSDWHWVISDPGHSSIEDHPEIEPLRENPRRR